LVVFALPGIAIACSESLSVDPNPRQSAEDCSFSQFGVTGNWSGRPVKDFGDGKTGQLIVSSDSCPYQEKLHFVDCTTGQSVSVNGVYEPSIQKKADSGEYLMLGGDLMIKYIQPPFGAVGISSKSTAESVSAAAQMAGYEWSSDILNDLNVSNAEKLDWLKMGEGDADLQPFLRYAKSRSGRRQFDAMCGCKIFYPDSAGAQN
jgi:hypothetical protein